MKEGVRGMRRASSVKDETRASLQVVVMGVKTTSVIPSLKSRLSAGGGASLVITLAPTRERGKVAVVLGRFSSGVRTRERVRRAAGSFVICVGVVGGSLINSRGSSIKHCRVGDRLRLGIFFVAPSESESISWGKVDGSKVNLPFPSERDED